MEYRFAPLTEVEGRTLTGLALPFEVETLTDCGNAEARPRRCMLSSGTS